MCVYITLYVDQNVYQNVYVPLVLLMMLYIKSWSILLKRPGGGGVKPIYTFALWKKLPDFQTASKVLSDKLFGSYEMFFILSLVQHIYKGVFFY